MKWTAEAEDAIKKIPFFVRKRVRARVEKEAEGEGKSLITIAEVKATQARFLSKMETDIKGYQIETCFGAGGCPNRANAGDGLMQKLEALLAEENLLDFLKKEVKGPLKYHHEFRITLADCPNACSQPQIKDIGIIGACVPEITQNPCSQCEACVDACREQAISLETGLPGFSRLSSLTAACPAANASRSAPRGPLAPAPGDIACCSGESWAGTPNWPASFPAFSAKTPFYPS